MISAFFTFNLHPPRKKLPSKSPALLGLTHRKTTVLFTEASLILKLKFQFLSLFFLFCCFQISILKLWAEGLIGIKIIFTLLQIVVLSEK